MTGKSSSYNVGKSSAETKAAGADYKSTLHFPPATLLSQNLPRRE